MQVDNSGETAVFDSKTKEAMDAAKNRINLLQAEEQRISKLVGVLKGEVAKLDEEIAYKKDILLNTTKRAEEADLELASVMNSIVAGSKEADALGKLLKKTKVEMEHLEAGISELQKKAGEKEAELDGRESAIAEREASVASEEADLKVKVQILEKALASL